MSNLLCIPPCTTAPLEYEPQSIMTVVVFAHQRAAAHLVVEKGVALLGFAFISNFMWAKMNQRRVSNHLVGSKKKRSKFFIVLWLE